MKTSFSKKLLACVLSLCMILTVCAGALSVSAAATATVVIDEVTVDSSDSAQSVDVNITATADDVIGGADLYVNVPEAANITKVQVTDGYNITFASNGTNVTAEGGTASENTVDETDNVAQFVVLCSDADSIGTELVVTLTFTGVYTDGTYAISLATGTLFGTYAEDTIEYTETAGAIVAKAAHTCTPADAVKENVVAATCTTAGSYDSVVYCSDCEEEISRKTVTVDALGHTDGEAVVENEEKATCYSAGSYDSVIYCTVCSVETSRTTVTVPMTAHTPAEAVVENEEKATCEAAGSYDSVVYCSVEGCSAEISRETITTEKLDHSYTYTDNGDGTHSATCSNGCAGITNEEHTYTEGTCVCDAVEVTGPVPDETIAPGAHAIGIGDTFGISFRFDLSTISDEYDSFELDIHRTTTESGFNFSYEDTTLTTFSKNTSNNILICTTAYYGIQLFSLTAPIEYTLHCFDADGNEVAYSETFTTTLAEVAVNYHDLSTTSVAMKKVMADLIQVGAAALNHFTTNRTKECDYSTLPVPTIESDYITTELGDMATYNSQEGDVALTITGGVQQSLYYNMRFSEDVANKEQYRYEISFYNALKKSDVTYTVDSSTMKGNTSIISAQLATFPVFATDADVTFKLYKNDAVVSTAHYCLEQYISSTISTSSSETLKTMLQELGELAQSFRTARNI